MANEAAYYMQTQSGINITNPFIAGGLSDTYVPYYTQVTSQVTSYVSKEEVQEMMTLMLAKQRLYIQHKELKEAGLDPKNLLKMLNSPDQETVKYALAVINEFI